MEASSAGTVASPHTLLPHECFFKAQDQWLHTEARPVTWGSGIWSQPQYKRPRVLIAVNRTQSMFSTILPFQLRLRSLGWLLQLVRLVKLPLPWL